MTRPLANGALAGAFLPLVLLAPALLWGPLPRIVADGATIYLLPVMMLLVVPGGFAGYLAGRMHADGRDTWRFIAGLGLGGSLLAAFLLMLGPWEFGIVRKLLVALVGGPFLAGFWLWLGGLLGANVGQRRRQAETAPPATANP